MGTKLGQMLAISATMAMVNGTEMPTYNRYRTTKAPKPHKYSAVKRNRKRQRIARRVNRSKS